jgi:twitching motility two-component system response regulator PilG
VLYASAEAWIGDRVSQAIAAAGAQVDVAQDGEHALELIERGRYACAFVDAALPGIDGYQLCRLVKSKRRASDLPVILLKAGASAFERIRASIAGCDAFLATPASDEELRAVAARMLPRRGRSAYSGAMPHA